nr:ATP-binding protein [Cytobacillus firmus]
MAFKMIRIIQQIAQEVRKKKVADLVKDLGIPANNKSTADLIKEIEKKDSAKLQDVLGETFMGIKGFGKKGMRGSHGHGKDGSMKKRASKENLTDTSTDSVKGLGLGLPFSKLLADALNANLFLKESSTKGTAFTIKWDKEG